MLDGKGDLSTVELAFFTPALLISLVVLSRHGFARQLGWIYICLLSVLRIIGAATTVYSETQNDHSRGILTTAAITSAIGTAPLLLALMGFLVRINEGMQQEHQGLSQLVFRPIHLAALAALVIAIIGGIDKSSADPSTASTGTTLTKAAAILFFLMYLALGTITLLTVRNTRWVLAEEETLLRACVVALPFLLIRIVYTIAVGFAPAGSAFDSRDVNVWAQALMQFLMDALVVCVYIIAGLVTPQARKPVFVQGGRDLEGGGDRGGDTAQEYGRVLQRG